MKPGTVALVVTLAFLALWAAVMYHNKHAYHGTHNAPQGGRERG